MPVKHETTIKKVVLGVAISSLLAGCGSDGVANDDQIQNINNSTITTTSSTDGTSSSEATNSSAGASSSEAVIVHDFIEPTTSQKVIVVFSAESTDLSATEETTLNIAFKDADTDEAIDLQGELTVTSTCNDNGQATITQVEDSIDAFTYKPAGCSGNDNIVLSGEWAEGVAYSKTVQLAIEEGAGSVSAAAPSTTKLDLDGSGSNNTASITFTVKTPSGTPLAGERVNFSFTESGTGATLNAAFGDTDESGLVTVIVSSGSKPGPVRIKASLVNSEFTGVSETISMGTGLPSAKRFNLNANHYNPNAYNYAGGQKVSLTARAADSTGNPVSDGTKISFWNLETGSMPTSCESLDGQCTVDWIPAGSAGRPDNGRIQVAALINVAEDFNDNNANFIFDDGDTITCRPLTGEIGEPLNFGLACVEPLAEQGYTDLIGSYIDLNESNAFELGIDKIVDSNGNTVRDLGDGKWTGPNCQHSDPANYCSDNSLHTFARSVTLTLSKDDSPSFCGGTGVGESFEYKGPADTREVGSEGVMRFDGLSISDGNIFALNPDNALTDCPTGNSLPAGTKIEFSADFGKIKNLTGTYPIPNTTYNPANLDFGFTYEAPKIAAGEMKYDADTTTITMPAPYDGAEGPIHSFFWPITVK